MNLLLRKVNIRNHNVPLVLLLLAIIGIVAATAYITQQFNISVTVSTYPKVTFWNWNAGTKSNTFTYSVNIFPSVKTIDENITYGIFCDDSSSHTCYLRIYSATNTGNIAKLSITIYSSSGTILTKEWTDFSTLPTDWNSFTTSANQKYTIQVEITGSSGATSGTTSTLTFDMKEENP